MNRYHLDQFGVIWRFEGDTKHYVARSIDRAESQRLIDIANEILKAAQA